MLAFSVVLAGLEDLILKMPPFQITTQTPARWSHILKIYNIAINMGYKSVTFCHRNYTYAFDGTYIFDFGPAKG